jgi:hypothetical protein
MTTRRCDQCGQPLPENAKFCGQCGKVIQAPGGLDRTVALQPPAAGPKAAPLPASTQLLAQPQAPTPIVNAADKTMMAFGGTPNVPAPAPPAPAQPAAPPPDGNKKTMLGVLAPGVAPAESAVRAAGGAPAHNKTMLGVAMPGIAPLREAVDASPISSAASTMAVEPRPPQPQPQAAPAPRAAQGPAQTLIYIAPPPAPLADVPAPPPPRIVKKGGFPLAAVALTMGVVVLLAGAAIALFWHGAPPVTALPRVAPDGKDVLHLTCDPKSCNDGTTVELDGAKATFAAGECDLTLTKALSVGDNALALRVDRPGMGRDEVLKLVVPVAFRVRADVTTMSAAHAGITIHVEALPGSDARVDGKPLALDAKGIGSYVIDESAAAEGAADESRVVSVDVPYEIATKGRPAEKGTVSARVAVAPLRVDAPGARGVVEEDHVLVAGRAAKGASVTVDGNPVLVGPDGAFETTVALGAPGERVVDVRAGTSLLTPRTVHVTVKRVASLADEARAFEQQQPLGYDAAMANLTGTEGSPIVVEGEVLEARASGHRTLLLVDDKRGCARGPCLARVIVGRDLAVGRGEPLRAYGRVARAFTTTSGQTVPEVEADFLTRSRR